jgi:hypothetical protein
MGAGPCARPPGHSGPHEDGREKAWSQWPADDKEAWAERAAIIEFDGNMPRTHAERMAYDVEIARHRKRL